MLKSYIKIAWRNILRHKTHTAINVAGLAMGMTCCLFIFLWVRDEKAIDNFHTNGKNLYAVYQNFTTNGKTGSTYTTPTRYDKGRNNFLMDDITQAVPGIKNQAYYITGYDLPWGHPETFQFGDKMMKLEGSRTSENFFKMFSYRLLDGTSETALKQINGVAISRKMAEFFFGSPSNAMGKTLRVENRLNFMVTAVFENLSTQSSLKFDYLFNWEAQKKLLDFSSNDFKTFVQLADNANPKEIEAQINQVMQTRLDKTPGVTIRLALQPYGDQYLHNIFANGAPAGGRIEYVRIFTGVAIFILIIACINFMNLATARAVKRAREIGLRKVVGSTRAQLIAQFFCEALFFAFLAMSISIALLFILMPAFNNFTGKQITVPITQMDFWLSLITLVVITGLVAGSYPALYLSSLKPVRILKGVLRFTQGASLFRKGLTVFQFVLSIGLIIATLVILRQVAYVQNTHLGYDRGNLVYLRVEGEMIKAEKYTFFKNRLAEMPGIAMVDRSTEAPHAMDFVVTDAINWQGKDKNASVGFKPSSVGFDFIKLMHLQIAQGRDFSRQMITDSTDAFMVNEEAVRQMGMKNPIGQWVSAWNKRGHIVGILKDFHTQSLREPIMPVIIDVKENENFGVIIIRMQPGKTREALASMEQVYREINPNYPFAYQFVDEEYRKLYNTELVILKLIVLFAVLAISISCLGLLGLVMFSAEQRIKEISVRKVLGASITEIVAMFSKDFLQLVLIAFCIAAPVSWLSMHSWLQGFAYRVAISWWIFVIAGASAMLIALATLSYQAIKAANTNPVKSLRSE